MKTTFHLLLAMFLLLGTACGDGTIGDGGLAPDGDEDGDGTQNQDDCDPLDPAARHRCARRSKTPGRSCLAVPTDL